MLCEHSQTQAAVQVYCLADAMLGIQTIELLLTVHFSGVSGDFPVYLGLGVMPESINDIAAGEPIGVGPGLNLHGWSSVAVNERLLDQKAATFGIPKVNIQSITDMTQVGALIPKIAAALETVSSVCSHQHTRFIPRLDAFAPKGQQYRYTSANFSSTAGDRDPATVYGRICDQRFCPHWWCLDTS